MADEVERIIMQTAGEEEVRRLTGYIEQQREAMQKLAAQIGVSGYTQKQFAQDARIHAQNLAGAYADIDRAQKSLDALSAGGGKGKAAYFISGVAQAAQDAQYGLKNVENNILALTSAMGGWGVAVGIGASVAIELYTHWDDISKLWGAGHTDTEAERMEKLAKATHRTMEEVKALRDFNLKEGIIKGGDAPTKAEQKTADRLTEAYSESGGITRIAELAVKDALGGKFSRDALAGQATDEERKALKAADSKAEGHIDAKTGERVGSDGGAARTEILAKIRQRLIDEAKDRLASAKTPAEIDQLARILESAGLAEEASRLRDIIKAEPMGPPKPVGLMADEVKRFNATGESDTIAGPGQFHDRQQKAERGANADFWDEQKKKFARGEDSILVGPSPHDQKLVEADNKDRREKADRAAAQYRAMNPWNDDMAQGRILAAMTGVGPQQARPGGKVGLVGMDEQLRRMFGGGLSLDQAQQAEEEREYNRLIAMGRGDKDARDEARTFAARQRGDITRDVFQEERGRLDRAPEILKGASAIAEKVGTAGLSKDLFNEAQKTRIAAERTNQLLGNGLTARVAAAGG